MPSPATRLGPKGKAKAAQVFHEFAKGKLRSSSANGPKVTSDKQAVAIALSEGRKTSRSAGRGR